MLVTSLDQLTDELRETWLGKTYAIDVETTGLDFMHDELIGVALYVDHQSYYFVLKHSSGHDGSVIQEYLTLNELRMILSPVMAQREQLALLHNSKFDRHFFYRYDLNLMSRYADTLLAAQLLDENRRNGLKDLATLVDPNIDHVKYENLMTWSIYPKGCPYNVPLEPFAEYAEKDVIVTYKLWDMFHKQLPKEIVTVAKQQRDLQGVFNNIWMPMVGVLQEMEHAGMRIDVERAKELHKHYSDVAETHMRIVQRAGYEMLSKRELDSIPKLYWKMLEPEDEAYIEVDGEPLDIRQFDQKTLKELEADHPIYLDRLGVQTPVMRPTPRSDLRKLYFNVGSKDQLVDLILRDISLPDDMLVALTTTPKGGDSVNFDNMMIIKHYLGKDTPHYVDSLLQWRKASKFVTTYLEPFVKKVDNKDRIHAFFSMAVNDSGRGGTHTGRLSSSGPNLQNIPSRDEIGKQARECFVAAPGNVLIVADYSNMETVIQAHFSRDPVLLKAFGEGLDVHALTACGQHNIPYDKFVEEYKSGNLEYDRMRRIAKTTLFGTAYGMGVIKFQRLLLVQNGQEFSRDEVKHMLYTFNETYEGLTKWKKGVQKFAGEHGYVPTILGRKRRLPRVFSEDENIRQRAMRQGVNAIIQGSCADILFQAMVPIQAAFKSLGGTLIASVHDELIGEVPEEYADVAAKVMETLMVDLINPQLRCKLSAEAHYGYNWFDTKKG